MDQYTKSVSYTVVIIIRPYFSGVFNDPTPIKKAVFNLFVTMIYCTILVQ